MSLMAMVLPILPGQREQWNRMVEEISTTRRHEFVESRRNLGLHERTFLQETPMGDLVIITLEGENPLRILDWFRSDDPFARWMGERLTPVHGMDASLPLPESFLPQQVLDTGNEVSGTDLIAWVLPILPGKGEEWRRFVAEMNGPRNDELVASRRQMGLRQRVFFQSTPMGDLTIVTVAGTDPQRFFQWFGSSEPLARWVVEQLRGMSGVDMSQPPAPGTGRSRLVADSEKEALGRAA